MVTSPRSVACAMRRFTVGRDRSRAVAHILLGLFGDIIQPRDPGDQIVLLIAIQSHCVSLRAYGVGTSGRLRARAQEKDDFASERCFLLDKRNMEKRTSVNIGLRKCISTVSFCVRRSRARRGKTAVRRRKKEGGRERLASGAERPFVEDAVGPRRGKAVSCLDAVG